MQPIFQSAIDVVEKRENEIFSQQGQQMGKVPNWKPLASSTEQARANRWGHYKNPPNNPGINRWT